jgi:hypothetical protein
MRVKLAKYGDSGIGDIGEEVNTDQDRRRYR